MASRAELTPAAWEDLDAVFSTVLEVSGSHRAAGATYEGILAAVEQALPMPAASPSVAGRTGIPCDYRWVQHAGWLAFFHVEDDVLLVDRVLWGRSDWTRALGLS